MIEHLERDGAVITYEVTGDGPTLVFLHGVGSDRTSWQPQLDSFASRYRCIAPDLRGHGESKADAASISLEAFADDLAQLIDVGGRAPAHLCGNSMGSLVALVCALRNPLCARSLVLSGGWAHHPSAAAQMPARLDAIDTVPLAQLARDRVPMVVGPRADTTVIERLVASMEAKDLAAYRRSNELIWSVDLRDDIPHVAAPTMVLVGEHDTVSPPELSEELAGLIPGSTLRVMPDAGHVPNLERPAAFDELLAAFLSSVDERGDPR